VAWRDAMSRIGRLALPALGLALLMLVLHDADLAAPHLAPLLLSLGLAVPFTVWSGGVAAGRRLQRAGWLSVPEERLPPRTLRRGAHKRGFDDLMPPAAITLPTLPRPAMSRRGPAVLALASAALVALVLLPRTALSPELPGGLLAFVPALQESAAEPLQPVQVAAATTPRPARIRPYKPASTIDDAVRRRAYEAVAQRLGTENS